MKRVRTIALAGTMGAFASWASASDLPWQAPAALPDSVKNAPAEPVIAAPAAHTRPQWRAIPAEDVQWTAAGKAPLTMGSVPATPMRVETQAPVPVVFQAPAQPPAPKQPVPPITLPKAPPPVVVPAKPPEAAPLPRQLPKESQPLPVPRSQPTPALAPAPSGGAVLGQATPMASYSVWGSYAPSAKPSDSAAMVPVRHGTYGSPSLRLSRDSHILDGFMRPLTAGMDETVIFEDNAGVAERFFVQTEYLLWWVRQPQIPILATTAENANFGFFGQPGTVNLLGPGEFGSQRRDGFRVRVGGPLGNHEWLAFDASFFTLPRVTDRVSFNSNQTPTILRPFFAPNFNAEFGELVSFPGLATGTLDIEQSSALWGMDVNFRKQPPCGCEQWHSPFIGYRYLNLDESLTMTENLVAGPDAPDPVGTTIFVQDRFSTRNQFHGGQIGTVFGRKWGRVSVDGRASVALGVTHQTLDIQGVQQRTRPGQPTENFVGGLYAAGPNLGRFTKDRFSVVPEVTLNLGYDLTPRLKAYAGYNFLYWSNVIRPGDQIDRFVDLTYVPNAPDVPFSGQERPQPTFTKTGFWAQGIQFGLEFRW